MLGDQLARQREVEIAQGQGRRHRRAKFSHGLFRAPQVDSERKRRGRGRLRRRPGARQARPACATSTSRLHLPLRYEDETRVVAIASLHDGETGQVEGVVSDSRIQFRPRRQLVVKIADDSGDLVLRFLHFYPSQQKTLAVGRRVRVRGEARGGFFGLEMVHPSFKVVTARDAACRRRSRPSTRARCSCRRRTCARRSPRAAPAPISTSSCRAGIVPDGLPTLRAALAHLHEPAPGSRRDGAGRSRAPGVAAAEVRRAAGAAAVAAARQARARAPARAAARSRARQASRRAARGAAVQAHAGAASASAPRSTPTSAARVPMHRLLQGDVGSGKTVVAALAAARAIDAGWQCALMAPTEILAEQHLKKLVGWLAPLGVTVAWLTGSRKGKARDAMLAQVASGEAGLVVGTHAVIEEQVRFARLGLAIIDEQHRFGVAQRLALREKLHGPGRPRAASADDERDADPAHPGDDAVRRSGREHHRRAAARPHAGRHQAVRRHAPRRGDRAHPRRGGARPADLLGLPAGRRIGGARPEERDRDPRRALRGAARAG